MLHSNLTFMNLLMVRVVVGSCLCTQQMKGPFRQSTVIWCLLCVQQRATRCEKHQRKEQGIIILNMFIS